MIGVVGTSQAATPGEVAFQADRKPLQKREFQIATLILSSSARGDVQAAAASSGASQK